MITPEQRQLRKKYVGSSDCAAIMGLDPYRSAADVWLSKTGKVDDQEANEAMEAGTLLERAVLDWMESQIPMGINRDVFHAVGFRCANLDAVVSNAPEIIEAKTTGIVGPADPGYGESGSDELPDRVLIQVHHQFGVCGPTYRLAWVPVLIGGVGFRKYQIDRNDSVVDATIEATETFWTKHVQRDIPPDGFKPSLETLKRYRRVPKSVRRVPDELVEKVRRINEASSDISAAKEEAMAELLAAGGDAEAFEWSGGLATYYEQVRKAYTVKESTYRVLRFPKQSKQLAPVGAA